MKTEDLQRTLNIAWVWFPCLVASVYPHTYILAVQWTRTAIRDVGERRGCQNVAMT